VVRSSKKAVYAALFGNLGIAIAKLIAAILTGSTAMFAETLHSISDTFNQVLLLFGIKTSTKAATEQHLSDTEKSNSFGHSLSQPCYLEYLAFCHYNKVLVHY
jgi:divalent metal cation (Fe/Co/Zn/Cd) transporter